jgi:hypothetical protein
LGGKRQYTAVFAIGAKLLGSFRGAMASAQSRLRALQATAKKTAGSVSLLKLAFTGLFATFASFAAGKIFGQIFGTASQEAQEAHQRTRSLMVSLNQMTEIRKRGKGAAKEELARIYEHNKALEAQGVIQQDLLDDMSVIMARAHIPSASIQKATDKLADVLVATVGPSATQEDAQALAGAFRKAVSSGKVMALQNQGVDITKEQAAAFKLVVGPAARYAKLMEILGENYKNVNHEAQSTDEGKIALFRNKVKALSQEIGEKMLPAQAEMAEAWSAALPEIAPLLIDGVKLLLKLMIKLGNVVKNQLIPWWHEFQKTERFQQLKNVLKWMGDHLIPIAVTVAAIAAAFVGLSALSGLIGIISAFASPIGLIVLAILAVVAAIALMYYNWDKISAMFPQTAAVIEHFIEGFKLSFKLGWDFVIAIWKTVVALFTNDWSDVGASWKKVWDDMVGLANWWKETLVEIAKSVGKAFKDYFLSVFEDIKGIWTWMKNFSWSGIKKMFSEGKDAATAYGEQVSTGQAGAAGAAAAAGVAGGGTAGAPPQVPLSPEGLKAVQSERADIVADLQRPEIRNLVSATLAREMSSAEGQKDVLENLVNRSVAYKRAGKYQGIEQMIKGGFYGPWNRGETQATMAKGLSDARSQQVAGFIDEIKAGRNVMRGMTDQGVNVGNREYIRGEGYSYAHGFGEQYKTAAYLESQKAAREKANPPPQDGAKYARAFATGGVVTKPTLAMIGEKGPEAVVPLGDRGEGGGTSVNFAPNITIHGNASEAEQQALDKRLRDLARDFVSSFKRAQTHERRLSYEGGYG